MNGVINLKGRQYYTVARRVQDFRAACPIGEGWALLTEIISADAERVVVSARVVDPVGRTVAQGHAEERRSNRGVNSTSALENCETSAIGRALAAAGLSGSGEYASADEVTAALAQQKPTKEGPHPSWVDNAESFLSALEARGLDYDVVSDHTHAKGWGRPSMWATGKRNRLIEALDEGGFPNLYQPDS